MIILRNYIVVNKVLCLKFYQDIRLGSSLQQVCVKFSTDFCGKTTFQCFCVNFIIIVSIDLARSSSMFVFFMALRICSIFSFANSILSS